MSVTRGDITSAVIIVRVTRNIIRHCLMTHSALTNDYCRGQERACNKVEDCVTYLDGDQGEGVHQGELLGEEGNCCNYYEEGEEGGSLGDLEGSQDTGHWSCHR